MITVGLTGGIGAGKSTVAQIFKHLGIPVFNADVTARDIMNQNKPVIQQLQSWFGNDLYINEELNRSKLAQILFTDEKARNQVNQLVHPLVRKAFMEWKDSFASGPYVIHEAAILFETGFYKHFDCTILVTAPENSRINRVIERDHSDEASIRNRMNSQWTDNKKQSLADYIINNSGEEFLIPQIINIHQQILIRQHG